MIRKFYTLLLCIFLFYPTMQLKAQETVTDIDGNTYTTVTIGTQTWMAENLKTTRYSNNDPIENVTDNATWAGLTSGAYAIYPYTSIDGLNSDAEVLEAYGALYNWYAVADNRNICPTGWHSPSVSEWTTIVNTAGGEPSAGYYLKSTSGWNNDGNGTNDYGFTAIPGGYRVYDGSFSSIGNSGHWWSNSLSSDNDWSYYYLMSYDSNEANKILSLKKHGFSVRCLKNNLDEGLFEHHPLDGDANDIVGGNNGTAASFNPTTDRFNNVNSALYFYDTNNTVAIPSSNQFAFESNDFSISFWFTLDDITKEHNGLIGRDDFQGIAVEYNHDSDYKLYVFIDSDGADSWEFAWKPEYSSWENNKWYNLVLDRSGSNLNLYINGNLVETTTIDISVQNPTETPYYIGRSQLPNRPHLGKMDDLRFYNRSLSSSEVTDLYHEGDYYTTSDNLVAYYPFNASPDDESGNGNNGTLLPEMGYVNSRFEDGVTSAVAFNGTSQYIQVPHTASLGFNGEVTVCAWVNPFVVNVEQQAICGKGGGWWRTGWLLTLNNDKVRWHLGNGSTEDEGMFDSQLSIPANEWSFIVGLWKNGVMNVYINGILDPKSELWADGLVSTTNDMYIGKTDQPDFDFFFNGYIDDVRIYNRALSANEIRELYHEGDWSTITDIDGNVYPTVKIGEQEWMAENLRTTKYNDGSDIPTGYTDGDWAALTTGAYAIYPYTSIDGLNSDAEVLEAYGALYNWYAVNDSKGICPTGWKVPSDAEWYTLENYVDATINDPNATGWRGTDGGDKLKSANGWDGNGNGVDSYGFTALPGGNRNIEGYYYNITQNGNWWSSSQYDESSVGTRFMAFDYSTIGTGSTYKNFGFSIRCIKATGASHAELPYYQTFDNDLGDCYTYSVSGDTKFWNHNSTYQNAQMNGYNSGELEEDWLILPSVTLNYDGYYLSFDTWKRYGSDDSNNFLSLQYSTDYSGSGDPNAANWTELSFEPPAAEQVVTNSGYIDLSGIAGDKVYFAFRYYYNVDYVWWEVDNIKISSDLPPQVSTLPVENFYITPRAAKAGGSISNDYGFGVTDRGIIWGYTSNLNINSFNGIAYEGNTGTGDFYAIMEPIAANTTYYYRAFAISSAGTGYGEVLSLTTPNDISLCAALDNCDYSITTSSQAATDDTQWFGQAATSMVNGNAARSGFVKDTEYTNFTITLTGPGELSFYYKVSSQEGSDYLRVFINGTPYYEISGEVDWNYIQHSLGDGTFNITWDYSMDGADRAGDNCGWVDHIVYVPSGFPEVTTNQVDNIMNTSATINYSVLTNGGNSITERGVVWATWENPTLASYDGITNDYDGAGTGTFNSFLTGLSENTTYYVRAYASNIGTSYGSQLSFTTSQGSGFSKTFIVNMDRATYLYDDGTGTLVAGIFDPATDRVFISGNFSEESNWPIPGSDDTFELTPDPNNESYNQLIYTISLDLNEGEFQYKYFIFNNQSDPWDYGEWEGGPNRAIYIENGNDQNDSWGIINASDMVISQDQTITISAPGLYNINSWTWDFGEGAIPAQADGYGPHDVSYSTVGSKTITLALNSGEFTYTKENFIEVGNSPTVSDVGENELGTTYAVLGCIVNPNNFETTVKLEYGETSELGNEQTLPETYLGDTNHSIEVTLDGLTENTSYFYRFVAENIFGQTASEVTELRTACTYTIYANVPSGSQNVCGGGTYTYSTSSENAETFVWEINPESAGATESTSETAQISWNHTFSGDAQVRVRGVSGTCNSEWSNYLNIYVNNTISDIEISGETEACTTSEILYKLSRAANDSYQWEVTGGNIIAQTNQVATIRWNTSGNNLLRIIEDGEGGCPISSTLEVLVNSYVAPEVPQIHRKGSINILICTTPNMDYKWFKDGSVISGQTGQYVVARNNLGYYNVQITDDNNCPNTSNPLQVDTYAMAESVLSIFPNPTSGSFTIEALGEKVGAATVRISNSFGNIIFEQKVEKNDYLYQQQLNIPNLPQGIYIVSLAVEGDMPIKAKLTIY